MARIFGYQGKDCYIRAVWRIIVGCFASIMLMFTIGATYCFVKEFVCNDFFEWIARHTSSEVRDQKYLSNYIVFQNIGYRGRTRIINKATGEIISKNIDNVILSDDGDSLAVFFKGKKRGYINRFTGKIVIPAKYSKAWVFSEGLAAVEQEGELKFINHKGETVISKGFGVSPKDKEYLFHNGLCFIRDNVSNLVGVIDTSGNWTIEPQFSHVERHPKYIKVHTEYYQGLYTHDMQVVLPAEYEIVHLNSYSNTIYIRKEDQIPQLYDMDMNKLADFVIDDVSLMKYNTGDVTLCTDEDGDQYYREESKVANCMKYSVGGYYTKTSYGLMSKSGERLTQPLYTKIEAIAPDRYLCHPNGIVIDDYGRLVP